MNSHYLEYLAGDGNLEDAPNKDAALRNHDAFLEANPWARIEQLEGAAERIVNENASVRSRRGKLLKLMDRFNDALAPFVACRRGCNHCCHISVLITSGEAEMLAAASGRRMVPQRVRTTAEILRSDVKAEQDNQVAKWQGVPCPFLKNGECSVYDSRPSPCRVHHSLDETPAQCDLNVPEGSVPSYAGERVLQMSLVWLTAETDAIADIREFFPEEPT